MNSFVDGIKYGSFKDYSDLRRQNLLEADTLYFITDAGIIYRGTSMVVPKGVPELTHIAQNGTNQEYYVIRLTSYSIDEGNTQGGVMTNQSFNVYTKTAVNNIISVINQLIATHRLIATGINADGKATDQNYGHVELTDTVNLTTAASNAAAAGGGTAVTPLGVYNAVNSVLGQMAGAMQFRGTVGATSGHPVGQPNTIQANLPARHHVGDVWVVADAGTYAGQACEPGDMIFCICDYDPESEVLTPNDSDWSIVQQNLAGAVTAANTLDTNTLVLGDGNKTVKKLANGTAGQQLEISGNGIPFWTNNWMQQGEAPMVNNLDDLVTPGSYMVNETLSQRLASPVNAFHYPYKFVVLDSGDNSRHKITQILVCGANDTTYTRVLNGSIWSQWRRFDSPGVYYCFVNQLPPANNPCVANVIGAQLFSLAENTMIEVEFSIAPKDPILAVAYDTGQTTVNTDGFPIYDHGQTLGDNIIQPGDTCTFVFTTGNGGRWNLIGLHRAIDTTPINNSSNLITSGGVYSAIAAAVNKNIYYGSCSQIALGVLTSSDGNNFTLVAGAIAMVCFGLDVPAGASLNVKSTGAKAIYYRSESMDNGNHVHHTLVQITAGVINNGDTAIFVYDGTYWRLQGVNRAIAPYNGTLGSGVLDEDCTQLVTVGMLCRNRLKWERIVVPVIPE